jgi:ADP-L-glycero-D-manno-heptose 6-epimerase
MRVIVTGAAGFIGANLLRALNERGETDILAVDNLANADKFRNLAEFEIADYMDKLEFLERLNKRELPRPDVVFHEGACSSTMETDGRYMMSNNFRYSCELLDWCQDNRVPLVYASSASVYGLGPSFTETRQAERPLNVYGYSKLLFDHVVRRRLAGHAKTPITGLRYFNVYGPRESHKGRMASVAFHHFHQFRAEGKVRLFEGSHGFANGEQRRDFIHVDDIVKGNLHFWDHPCNGVFNLGTGRAQSFNDIALSVINALRGANGNPALTLAAAVSEGLIEYTPFPDALRGKYQAFTQADTTALRQAGFENPMFTVEQGVAAYIRWLLKAS